jgi:hypothetical protein
LSTSYTSTSENRRHRLAIEVDAFRQIFDYDACHGFSPHYQSSIELPEHQYRLLDCLGSQRRLTRASLVENAAGNMPVTHKRCTSGHKCLKNREYFFGRERSSSCALKRSARNGGLRPTVHEGPVRVIPPHRCT